MIMGISIEFLIKLVNLIEDKEVDLTPDSHRVSLFVTPYQIVTLRLVPDLT
jgi:hypothetical protein